MVKPPVPTTLGPQSMLMEGFGVPYDAQMLATEYADRWQGYSGTEVAHYQDHFNGLCELVGHDKPVDRLGSGNFEFQRAAPTPNDQHGVADVFLHQFFVMEYKRPGKSLDDAYFQVLRYRDSLGNPPLLIVSDFANIRIHTNFTGTVSETYYIALDDLRDLGGLVRHRSALGVETRGPLTVSEVLQACFHLPHRLKPTDTPEILTEQAAAIFKEVADELGKWNASKDTEVAKFLSQVLFAMFASDIGLLPKLQVTQLTNDLGSQPSVVFPAKVSTLIAKMTEGAPYDTPSIPRFNGGLFDGMHDDLNIVPSIIPLLREADQLDWSQIEPSIFGSLFEQVFNPEKRAQFGRHYTPRKDIEQIIEPVVMQPLREEWFEIQYGANRATSEGPLAAELQSFIDRIGALRVLDPACGSGNFLYVTLNLLHQLEREVVRWSIQRGITTLEPRVHPQQLLGIELDEYAQQLASVVVWIGHIQNGLRSGANLLARDPILDPLNNIERRNAVVTEEGEPRIPEWPDADCIVGNPPFLGSRRMRGELGNEGVESLNKAWDDDALNGVDFCMYWFEKARRQIAEGRARRAGLLGTQAIRQQSSRPILERIIESGGIFFAVSDQAWRQDGASVRIAMVGFDDGFQKSKELDGKPVAMIRANLTSRRADVTKARRLRQNSGIAFQGVIKSNDFVISKAKAEYWIRLTSGGSAKDTIEVLRPLVIGRDLNGIDSGRWVIDFADMPVEKAMKYFLPFEYLRKLINPPDYMEGNWWLFHRPRPNMRRALKGLKRYIATSSVSKHRIFVWVDAEKLADVTTVVFATDDDYDFGILQSKVHQSWTLATGTQLRDPESGRRYTHTTCFETFPFPEPDSDVKERIREAAQRICELRNKWLYLAKSTALTERDKFTLTNLYNNPTAEVVGAHAELDRAVFAAYGWSEDPSALTDDVMLERLLELNLDREPA